MDFKRKENTLMKNKVKSQFYKGCFKIENKNNVDDNLVCFSLPIILTNATELNNNKKMPSLLL